MLGTGPIRIIAIIFGVLIGFVLEYGLGAQWYVSLPLGVVGYLVTRYVGWGMRERRRIRDEIDQTVQKYRRGEPLD